MSSSMAAAHWAHEECPGGVQRHEVVKRGNIGALSRVYRGSARRRSPPYMSSARPAGGFIGFTRRATNIVAQFREEEIRRSDRRRHKRDLRGRTPPSPLAAEGDVGVLALVSPSKDAMPLRRAE